MKLTPLSKQEALSLENSTVRIENICPVYKDSIQTNDLMIKIQGWYHKHSLRPGFVREQWRELTKLFGFKPFYVKHLYFNALWAFSWNGNKVLLYCDKRGIAIQVEETFDKPQLIRFLKGLCDLLLK